MAPITLEQIRAILDGTLAKAKELGIGPMAVCVLDAGGHVAGYLREDGAPFIRFEIARGKAWAVAARGAGGQRLAEQAHRNPVLVQSLQSVTDHYFPVQGGVLVRNSEGAIVGAVGATGATSEQDEACAIAGIEAANLTAEA
jgi:uncharacterized protein GlcG (DUF336 family)